MSKKTILGKNKKLTDSSKLKSPSDLKKTFWNWLRSESGILGIGIGIVSVILGLIPLMGHFQTTPEQAKLPVEENKFLQNDFDHSGIILSANNNVVNSNNLAGASVNSSNSVVLTNSNNQISTINKTINQTPASPVPQDFKNQSSQTNENQDDPQEIEVAKPVRKSAAVKSPAIYSEIRGKNISGSAFERDELIQMLKQLKIIGQTVDFTLPSEGLVKAKEWIEVCSVLVGQTDVWLGRNSINSTHRNYFDSAEIIRNNLSEVEAAKALISLKLNAIDNGGF